jgi:hypothetical protein
MVLYRYETLPEVEVNLRPSVSRPVCPGVRRPSGTSDQFFFLIEILFRQLRLYYFVAPSLTRGRVCNLLYNCFWALPEQLLLGRSPTELTAIFYCLIWDSPNLEGQIPVFISPRNRVVHLYPRALGSLFVASYGSQGLCLSYDGKYTAWGDRYGLVACNYAWIGRATSFGSTFRFQLQDRIAPKGINRHKLVEIAFPNLIVEFCILLRVYPLMLSLKPPYATMFLCMILLCTTYYMFRPRSVAIFR